MVRYFVCKCSSMGSMRQCVESGVWACKDRETPPNPRDILTQALAQGPVILIFSVTNCHGWHGVCEMINVPGSVRLTNGGSVTSDSQSHDSQEGTEPNAPCTNPWHRFNVKWNTVFLQEFGERCLSSAVTSDLSCLDGQPVNKSRNLQELPVDVGEKMCQMIQQHYRYLTDQMREKQTSIINNQPQPFFTGTKEKVDVQSIWKELVAKVERDLGKVILACPFGSQRYNLQTAGSDMDMFIVYQADTGAMLGLEPPKHTVKNRESESYDYTVHEVHRYCELLTLGDPRCVETLFLHPSSIIYCCEEWYQLQAHQNLFLHSLCLEKYLRDGLGSNGVKQFDKWTKGVYPQDQLSPKLCKLVYIILRLLQNARDVTLGRLCVYRQEGSFERDQLLRVRAGETTVQEARRHIEQLLEVIEANKSDVETPCEEMKRLTENWLLKLRYQNFILNPPELRETTAT